MGLSRLREDQVLLNATLIALRAEHRKQAEVVAGLVNDTTTLRAQLGREEQDAADLLDVAHALNHQLKTCEDDQETFSQMLNLTRIQAHERETQARRAEVC